ncbi:hypothetical protein NEFER03_1994 [Nematocida sp. LUAm3]|nr:hypothetical protein NEFER03_1994 [Nematocida sp. LUAm3]KAI5176078.1 hypothetical protein NEFER02_1912 [Nematocida sp. LUAm2]KAI5177122.1 hypothetical protein NEFER01_0397 [Nematocida sp. LUAm1]
MGRFRAVVAPMGAGRFIEKKEEEKVVLVSNEENKYFWKEAVEEENSVCSYLIGEADGESSHSMEVHGKKYFLREVPMYICKTFPKKEIMHEEEGTSTREELSLRFGVTNFTRKYKKSKMLSEASSSINMKNEELHEQVYAPEVSCLKTLEVDLVPPYNSHASNRMDIYSERTLLEFDPYEIFSEIDLKELPPSTEHIQLCEKTIKYIKPVEKSSGMREKVLLSLIDGFIRIIDCHKKSSFITLGLGVPDIQKDIITKIIYSVLPKTKINPKVIFISKRDFNVLFSRLVILVLLYYGGSISISEMIPVLNIVPISTSQMICKKLGCTITAKKSGQKKDTLSLAHPPKKDT